MTPRRATGQARRRGLRARVIGRLLWAGALAAASGSAAAVAVAATAVLSPAQQQWLAQQGPWRLGTERDYGPFVFEGPDGSVQGLSIDMLRLAQQRTGLRVTPLPGQPLAQVLQAARRGEVDLISSLRPTPERAADLLFTQPYISVPAVVVMRQTRAPLGLADLVGQTVAVGQGYAVESVVRARHPAVLWQAVADDVAALRGVAEGRFAAAVVDAASMAFVLRQQGLTGLSATADANFQYALSFAVRRDLPQLRDILDLGFRALGPSERQAVLDRWLPPATQAPAVVASPWATRLGLGLLLGGVLLGAALQLRQRRRSGGAAKGPEVGP